MEKYGDKERREDFNYFVEHYQELYSEYGSKFLVIKNKEVIGSYEVEAEAIKETSKSYPLGTFIVQECNGNESAYTNYVSSWQLVGI